MPTSSFSQNYRKFIPRIVFWWRRIYIAVYNIYALIWLHRIICVEFTWEKLLLWCLAISSVFFFILNNRAKLKMEWYMKDVE